MSEATAAALASRLTGEAPAAEPTDTTNDIVEEEVSQEEVDETPEEETEAVEEESEEEPELPDAVKEILKKNRKAVREAEARAVAAEKALTAKEAGTEPESTPADDKFKKLYIDSAAKSALAEAGLTTGTDRFLKMLDLSSVEVDESGAVSGLSDQIADLKEDFKDLFTPKTVKKSTGNVDGSRRVAPTVPKSSAELLAARFS